MALQGSSPIKPVVSAPVSSPIQKEQAKLQSTLVTKAAEFAASINNKIKDIQEDLKKGKISPDGIGQAERDLKALIATRSKYEKIFQKLTLIDSKKLAEGGAQKILGKLFTQREFLTTKLLSEGTRELLNQEESVLRDLNESVNLSSSRISYLKTKGQEIPRPVAKTIAAAKDLGKAKSDPKVVQQKVQNAAAGIIPKQVEVAKPVVIPTLSKEQAIEAIKAQTIDIRNAYKIQMTNYIKELNMLQLKPDKKASLEKRIQSIFSKHHGPIEALLKKGEADPEKYSKIVGQQNNMPIRLLQRDYFKINDAIVKELSNLLGNLKYTNEFEEPFKKNLPNSNKRIFDEINSLLEKADPNDADAIFLKEHSSGIQKQADELIKQAFSKPPLTFKKKEKLNVELPKLLAPLFGPKTRLWEKNVKKDLQTAAAEVEKSLLGANEQTKNLTPELVTITKNTFDRLKEKIAELLKSPTTTSMDMDFQKYKLYNLKMIFEKASLKPEYLALKDAESVKRQFIDIYTRAIDALDETQGGGFEIESSFRKEIEDFNSLISNKLLLERAKVDMDGLFFLKNIEDQYSYPGFIPSGALNKYQTAFAALKADTESQLNKLDPKDKELQKNIEMLKESFDKKADLIRSLVNMFKNGYANLALHDAALGEYEQSFQNAVKELLTANTEKERTNIAVTFLGKGRELTRRVNPNHGS